MKYAAAMLVGAGSLLGLAVWIFSTPRPAPHSLAAPNTPRTQPTQQTSPVLPKDTDLRSLSPEALSGLIDSFREKSSLRVSQTNVVVGDGETVVTNGYEEKPGVFIFSTMTPYRATTSEGEAKINIRLQRLHVALGGSMEVGLNRTISTDPGHEYGVGYANEWGREGEQSYEIDIHADFDPGSGKIRLQAKEYQLHEPGAYAF